MARRVLAVCVLLLLLLAGGTYVAGERHEVAVLRTFDDAGHPHDTKLWVVDIDGAPWIRAARAQRSWLQRIRRHPDVLLTRGGRAAPFHAVPDASPETARRVDAAFAAKYGRTDWWYGVVIRSHPVPVRLVPPGAG